MLEPKQFLASERLTSPILDHIRLPVFLVDGSASVLFSNAAAKGALKDGDHFKQIDNFLFAMHQADNSEARSPAPAPPASARRL
jgi:hypothetical protein